MVLWMTAKAGRRNRVSATVLRHSLEKAPETPILGMGKFKPIASLSIQYKNSPA